MHADLVRRLDAIEQWLADMGGVTTDAYARTISEARQALECPVAQPVPVAGNTPLLSRLVSRGREYAKAVCIDQVAENGETLTYRDSIVWALCDALEASLALSATPQPASAGPVVALEYPPPECVKVAEKILKAQRAEKVRRGLLPEETREAHPDDLAVDRFAAAMKAKLAKKRGEGRGGWDNPDECSVEYLSYLLVQHLHKGDPVDIGNFAMMLQQRGSTLLLDDEALSIMPRLSSPTPVGVSEAIETYYARQIEWSKQTFGPNARTGGVLDHIRKELKEIEAEPTDLSEWVDVIILAMDGFWRHGGSATDLMPRLLAKQKKNMARVWPDWRNMSEDSAIEHDRSHDEAALRSQPPAPKEQEAQSVEWRGKDIPLVCPYPEYGREGAPTAYDIDPGAGSATDRLSRDWPVPRTIKDMQVRGGSITALFAAPKEPAPGVTEARLPTREEAASAAAVLLRCNGHDLDVWGADGLLYDEAQIALKALQAAMAARP